MYFILRRIALVDDVHDFVDFLVAEVFLAEAGAWDERDSFLEPLQQVFEGPADACPQPVDGAEVDEQGDNQDEGCVDEDALGGGQAVSLAGRFLLHRRDERVGLLAQHGVAGVAGRLPEGQIMGNLCGVKHRTVLVERVLVGSLLLFQLCQMGARGQPVNVLLPYLTATEQEDADEKESDDLFVHDAVRSCYSNSIGLY